jgi:CubicO group peptidase (beta-lactamase class C family)
MVPVGAPRYGARCMAASRARRAGARHALLIVPIAVAAAVATVTLGPILATQRAPDLIGALIPPTPTPTPTPAPTPAPSPSPTPTTTASRTPSTTAAPTPSAITTAPPTAMPSAAAPSAPSPTTAPSSPTASVPAAASPSPGPVAGAPPTAEPPTSITRPRLAPTTRLALQARLDRLRERYAIPGISVAIVLPDGSTWLGVSGMADVAAEAPVTRSTSFAIASVSKTYTAALILALAEEGRIDLNAPVRQYLPDLKKISVKVKVRHLLDHTSGLRDYFFHASIDKLLLSRPDRRWDGTQAMKYVGKAYFEAGKGWHYSNTNYLVLGMLAEAVGKASLADQVRARFLRPLDLDHTWYQPEDRAPPDVAHGYRFASAARTAPAIDLSDGTPLVPFTSVVTAAGGAGGFAASANDLAHWAQALFGGDVLAPEYLEAMVDVAGTAAVKSAIPYGYGVQVIEIDGRRTLGHSGRLLGFRAAVRYLPDQGVSIAVLTNQSRTDPGLIVRSLLRVALTPADDPCRCREHR